ncbi:MAG: GntR family transcriptional regulator [Betaproteobacteria bacterium]|nr:GntR family transcriptional regulator [Betaproteobacteria bacterium]MBI2961557.1 GntR family transcriptional regulator [Betaproteobacteria bacterium]
MNDALRAGVETFAPLYIEVKRLITQGLIEGEWQAGAALPSETRLAQRYHVSIGTIRRAVDELVAEQILVRQQGRGTFVATHDPKRLLFHFFHVVRNDGVKEMPEPEMLAFERDRADTAVARRLNLLPGERVFRIRNLVRLAGEPMILDELVLSQARFPDLTEKIFREREATVYALYQTRYGINVVRAAERLRATAAERASAKLLNVRPGAPLLEIHRTAMTYHNTPVELRTSLVNTAAHEYWSDFGKA